MLKNPQDRRARRTAEQIRQAMYVFLETRPIHRIRVSDICAHCQINRATFYDHYRDVFDLVQDMENELLAAMERMMETVAGESTPSDRVSRLFFDFLADHSRTLGLLLTSERSREFSAKLNSRLMPFFEKKIRQSYLVPPGMERELRSVMEFAANGYYRFFLLALTEPGRDIETEAALCARLSDACISTLFRRRQSDGSPEAS